jgi:hypothetical protein
MFGRLKCNKDIFGVEFESNLHCNSPKLTMVHNMTKHEQEHGQFSLLYCCRFTRGIAILNITHLYVTHCPLSFCLFFNLLYLQHVTSSLIASSFSFFSVHA